MALYPQDDQVFAALDAAVEEDAFVLLNESEKGRRYLAGIREALRNKATPAEIMSRMHLKLGSDREAWALRITQAARFVYRTEFEGGAFEPEGDPLVLSNPTREHH